MFYQIAIYEEKDRDEPIMDIGLYALSPKNAINQIVKGLKSGIKYVPENFKKCYNLDNKTGIRCSYIIK